METKRKRTIDDDDEKSKYSRPGSVQAEHTFHLQIDGGASMKPRLTQDAEIIPEIKWTRINFRDCLNLQYGIVFNRKVANGLFQQLQDEVKYYSDEMSMIRIYGRKLKIPRKQVAYSDPGLVYHFSGSAIAGLSWTPLIKSIKDAVERASGFKYNFVLVNKYVDGNDGINFHRDAEPDLDPFAPICSISLGENRMFVLKHIENKFAKRTLLLEHGSMLIMRHPTNVWWQHALPKNKKYLHSRINLTFRSLLQGVKNKKD